MTTTIAKQVQTRLRTQMNEAHPFIGGADLGNSTSLYKDREALVQIPSFVGIGNLEDLISSRTGSGNGGSLKDGEYVVDYGGVSYFVGDLAVSQLVDATTQRGDWNRYSNGHTLILLMALVAAAHPTLTSIKVRLVTGLPIKLFRERPQLKADVRTTLEGDWFYTFYDKEGARGMSLQVESVGVVMEGLSAATAFGTPGKPQVIVDIGGGSFDVAFINAKGEVLDARSGSLMNNGSERIGELLSGWFRQRYGRSLTPSEIDEVLANYTRKQDTTIYESGERTVELSDVQRAIDTVTASGNSFLSQKLGPRPGSDAAMALVIGGAARFIRPLLHCSVTIPDAPERTNVEAYQVFAQRAEAKDAWPKKA